MLPYIILIGLPALSTISLLNSRNKFLNKDRFIVDLFFLIFLLLLVFRSETLGVDLPVYKLHFNNYSLMPWKDILINVVTGAHEAGYLILCKFVSIFRADFNYIKILCAAISILPIWWLYRINPKHGFLMAVLFVNIAPFTMYFSGLRQAMAMAFSVPCYCFCKKKELKKFLLMIFFACMFHRSALVLLLMYPVFHLRIKRQRNLLYLVPFLGVVYYFNLPIFQLLMQVIGDRYYERYYSEIAYTGAYSVLLVLCAFLVYSFYITDSSKIDDVFIGLRNILVLCIIIQIFAGVHTVAMRMNYYYLIFIPLLISKTIENRKPKYQRIVLLSILCLTAFFTVYFFNSLHTGSDILGIYPYKSIFADIG